MAVGFEARNDAGDVIVSSDYKYHYFLSKTRVTVSAVDGVGLYGNTVAFGNLLSHGLGRIPLQRGRLNWIKFDSSQWGMVGNQNGMFKTNTADVIQTGLDSSPQSGYLDVRDSSGNLVWSAASAAKSPRVRALLRVAASSVSGNSIASFALGYAPWICQNACPGYFSDDGLGNVSIVGLFARWTGSQLQFCSGPHGAGYTGDAYIPVATFIGH